MKIQALYKALLHKSCRPCAWSPKKISKLRKGMRFEPNKNAVNGMMAKDLERRNSTKFTV